MSLKERILRILREAETIGVVGFSTSAFKPSHYVPAYLMEQGYRTIPVHPTAEEILGLTAYPKLSEIPDPVDLALLFRPSDEVGPHVEMAIDIGARFVWMQLGIANSQAARAAEEAGLEVVMDHCMMVEHRRYRSQL